LMYEDHEIEDRPSLKSRLAKTWADMNDWRPVSFYLIFAIFIVLILGTQIYFVRDNPHRYVFIVSLMLVFFLAAMILALYDVTDLIRRNLRERRELFRATLGDEAFMRELDRRVAEHRDRE